MSDNRDSGSRPLLDDTKEWHGFFWNRGLIPRHAWPVAIIWIREVEPPYRFGFGLRFRGLHKAHAFGYWFPWTKILWNPKVREGSVLIDKNVNIDWEDDDWVPEGDVVQNKVIFRGNDETAPGFWFRNVRGRYWDWKARRHTAKVKALQADEDAKIKDWLENMDQYVIGGDNNGH